MMKMWVLRNTDGSVENHIIGCAGAQVDTVTNTVIIGPVAVRPNYQVNA